MSTDQLTAPVMNNDENDNKPFKPLKPRKQGDDGGDKKAPIGKRYKCQTCNEVYETTKANDSGCPCCEANAYGRTTKLTTKVQNEHVVHVTIEVLAPDVLAAIARLLMSATNSRVKTDHTHTPNLVVNAAYHVPYVHNYEWLDRVNSESLVIELGGYSLEEISDNDDTVNYVLSQLQSIAKRTTAAVHIWVPIYMYERLPSWFRASPSVKPLLELNADLIDVAQVVLVDSMTDMPYSFCRNF